jgi:hypothetical protein
MTQEENISTKIRAAGFMMMKLNSALEHDGKERPVSIKAFFCFSSGA